MIIQKTVWKGEYLLCRLQWIPLSMQIVLETVYCMQKYMYVVMMLPCQASLQSYDTKGYSLKCWRTGLNVMLEKQAGNLNVEKLQIILLFEGDFNQNNKWLGQAVMFQMEEQHQMAPEQYRSCKEKLADIQWLNKRLLYDYTCYTHTISNLLEQCKTLLWLHCANVSCALSMQIRSTQTSSTKHGIYNTWYATSCALHIRWFNHTSRQSTMDCTHHRDWARQWCRPTDLGSSKHTTLPDFDQGGLSSTDHLHNV